MHFAALTVFRPLVRSSKRHGVFELSLLGVPRSLGLGLYLQFRPLKGLIHCGLTRLLLLPLVPVLINDSLNPVSSEVMVIWLDPLVLRQGKVWIHGRLVVLAQALVGDVEERSRLDLPLHQSGSRLELG